MSGAQTTWGEQYDKGALRGTPFWIHNMHESEEFDSLNGERITVLVVGITINGPSRKDPHAVITLGNSAERQDLFEYFKNPNAEPIGPVHCFEVPLKQGRSFWRIEDYDAEIVSPSALAFDPNDRAQLPSGKR
jgi:hypothetical protein